jgi:hypothetical protein
MNGSDFYASFEAIFELLFNQITRTDVDLHVSLNVERRNLSEHE